MTAAAQARSGRDNKMQIVIALLFTAVMSAVCSMLRFDSTALTAAAVCYIVYIIFAHITGRRYIPLVVYIGFVIMTAVQIGLISSESLSPAGAAGHSGHFPSIGAAVYCLILIISAALMGAVNLIRFIVCFIGKNDRENGS